MTDDDIRCQYHGCDKPATTRGTVFGSECVMCRLHALKPDFKATGPIKPLMLPKRDPH